MKWLIWLLVKFMRSNGMMSIIAVYGLIWVSSYVVLVL